MGRREEFPEDLSKEVLRITLEELPSFNLGTGQARFIPSLKLEYWAGQTPRGRNRWKRALPGLLCQVSGIENPTGADLLEAMARIIRQQAAGAGPLHVQATRFAKQDDSSGGAEDAD